MKNKPTAAISTFALLVYTQSAEGLAKLQIKLYNGLKIKQLYFEETTEHLTFTLMSNSDLRLSP